MSLYYVGVASLTIYADVLFVSSGLFNVRIFNLFYSASLIVLMVAGSFLLFRLQKEAVVVLGLILALAVVSRLVQFLTTDAATMRGALGHVFWELGVEALMFFRAVQLRRQAILS